MTRSIMSTTGCVMLALLMWAGYGYLVYSLGIERDAYATLMADSATKESRERAVSKIRGSVRDTREQREILESRAEVDVIQAVSTIEAVGEHASVRVAVDGATSGSSNEHVRTILVSLTLEGVLSRLLDALTILETLPFPAVIEHVDFSKGEKDVWTARLRVRVITTSAVGV